MQSKVNNTKRPPCSEHTQEEEQAVPREHQVVLTLWRPGWCTTLQKKQALLSVPAQDNSTLSGGNEESQLLCPSPGSPRSLAACLNQQEHKHISFRLRSLNIWGEKKNNVKFRCLITALWIVLISSQLMASLLSSERLIAISAQHSS